jgi:ubiquinone biosynthesis protein Coq4
LKCHDIAHIVFGCVTTIYGEGLVKIWTTFGSKLSFKEVTTGYKSAKAYELAQAYSFEHVLTNIIKLLFTIPKVIYRAKRMTKLWPFMECESFLNRSIVEIREEFGIRIVT